MKDYKNQEVKLRFQAKTTGLSGGLFFELDKIRIEYVADPDLKVTAHKGKDAWYKNGEAVTIGGTYNPGGGVKSFVVQVNNGNKRNVTTNSTAKTWSYTYTGDDIKKANFRFTITDTDGKSKDTTIVVNVDKTAPTLGNFQFSFAQGENPAQRYQKDATSMLFVKKNYGKLQGNWLFNNDMSGFPVVDAYYFKDGETKMKKSSSTGIDLITYVSGLHSVSMSATDSAGNESGFLPNPAKQYYVDDAVPTITEVAFTGADPTKMYAAKSDGLQWYGATTPSLSAKIGDGDGSGLKSATYLEIAYDTSARKFNGLPVTEGLHSGSISAADNVANDTTSQEYKYRVDLTAPVLEGYEFMTDVPAYMYGLTAPYKLTWYNQKDVSARIKSEGAHDAADGVGLWKSTFKVRDGEEKDFPATAGALFYLDRSKEGEFKCTINLLDSVRNASYDTLYYGIDGTKPRILTNYKKHVLYADDYSEALSDTLSGLKSFQYSFDLVNWADYDDSKINDLLVVGNVYLKAVDNVDNSDTLALYSVDAKNLVTVKGNKVVYALLNKAGSPYFNQYMEAIDDSIFLDRTDITNLEIPESVKKIGAGAFKGCPNLGSVFCLTSFVPEVGSEAFADDPEAVIYVLPEYQSAFLADQSWAGQIAPGRLLSMVPANDEIWYLTTDGSAIDASVLRSAFSNVDTSIYGKHGIIKFTAENDRVARFAFQNNEKLRMLFLPNSVNTIQHYAFQSCKNLEVIHTTGNLDKINDLAFDGCDSLRLIFIREGLEEIGAMAFADCKALHKLTLPASIEYIGSRTFYGCEGMESITLLGTDPENVNMTHESFEGLKAHTPIFVPSNKLLLYEAYNYGKGINFQTKFRIDIYFSGIASAFCALFFHHNFIVPEGVEVYGATWDGRDNFVCGSNPAKAGDIVAGNKGYLFKSGPRVTYYIETTSKSVNKDVESDLTGSPESVSFSDLINQGYKVYEFRILNNRFERSYFGISFPYGAFGRVKLDNTLSAKSFDFDNWYNGWLTGVQTPSEPTTDSVQPTYNLSGQQVGSDYKGIVIRNGKKYLAR